MDQGLGTKLQITRILFAYSIDKTMYVHYRTNLFFKGIITKSAKKEKRKKKNRRDSCHDASDVRSYICKFKVYVI